MPIVFFWKAALWSGILQSQQSGFMIVKKAKKVKKIKTEKVKKASPKKKVVSEGELEETKEEATTSKRYPRKKKAAEKAISVPEGDFSLVIVESPTKAKTIKKYLGRGFQVIACNGHIKDLPKSKLGVDLKKNFEPMIVPLTGKKAIIDKIQRFASKAEKIYLAPDPDREGEAIAYHLAEEINKPKKIARVLFNAITKQAVIQAIAHPSELDPHKYESQKTRRILDRLVGYKISPLLWDKVQRGLSAGRVQSVALRLIVEREDEIVAFTSEQWFSLHALFKKDQYTFEAKYYGTSIDQKEDLDDLTIVKNYLAKLHQKPFEVIDVKKKEVKQRPTPPFTTSKLQQEAANKLGFSAKKTMMVAQRLYEGIELQKYGTTGLITYMRTDSIRTEPQAIHQLRSFIREKYGNEFVPEDPIFYTRKKGAGKVQDAHEAIRPAQIDFIPAAIKGDLEPDEFKLYELIWNKFVASQMMYSVIDQTTVSMNCEGLIFKTTGSIVKFAGFRQVYLDSLHEKRSRKGDEKEDQEGGDHQVQVNSELLPHLDVGERLKPLEPPKSEEHWTSPPPRYNDASIVKDLEEKGIGRPSTYASIISNIVDKGYVEKQENRYTPTLLGIEVSRLLVLSFPQIMDVDFTAKIEEQLDQIEEGEVKWTKVLKDFWGPFEVTLEKAKEEMKNLKKTEILTPVTCLKCGLGPYLIKWGRNGQFLACQRYPECTGTEDFKKHLDGTFEIIPKVYAKDPCPNCQKRLIVKKGKYGRFLACEEYPHCKTSLPYTIDVHCPLCVKGRFAEKKSRYGKFFYGCSSYPECKNAMWDYPVVTDCPNCESPVMGKKETKRRGLFLSCPKCRGTKEWESLQPLQK
jgi:DNA topoisomerase-1